MNLQFVQADMLAAVNPVDVPQRGVKRPLLGAPVNVPNNLPAFRGKLVAPVGALKVPKLSQGNKNNRETNVGIPYSRVCPLEFLSSWTGRLSPGDVAFVFKEPPGFLSSNSTGNNATNGTATMSRVIGLDGVNRLLHGTSSPDGWVAGHNVLVVDPGKSALNVLTIGPNEKLGGFKLRMLDSVRLDGVVQSNDEPFSFTSNGKRDAAVFNNVIQGVCPRVNNGYLLYDPRANPSYNISSSNQSGVLPGLSQMTHGAAPLRTVEAYPRGSIEGGYHLGGGAVVGRVGSPWLGDRSDFLAAFTGTFTAYPAQMFDRNVQALDSLFIGVRAYELSTESKLKVWNENHTEKLFQNPTEARTKSCFFYQLVPFSSRKAWLAQFVQDELSKKKRELLQNEVDLLKPANPGKSYLTLLQMAENALANPRSNGAALEEQERRRQMAKVVADGLRHKYVSINASLASHSKGAKKSRFDDDMFDAVRTEDLGMMVGAWHLGKVLDVQSMRHASYEGGPEDTSFAVSLDVQIGWRNAFPLVGGSIVVNGDTGVIDAFASAAMQTNSVRTVEYGSNTFTPLSTKSGRFGESVNNPVQTVKKEQLAVDTFNAQHPAMSHTVGKLFGSSLYSTDVVQTLARSLNGGAKMPRSWETRVPARWPNINSAWIAIFELGKKISNKFLDDPNNSESSVRFKDLAKLLYTVAL